MQSIPPNGYPRPENEEGTEPPAKRKRIETPLNIESLVRELLIKVAGFLKPKEIFLSLAATSRLFNEIASTFYTPANRKKWKHWVAKEFPESYAALTQEVRESNLTEWYEIYAEETAIRKNIISGNYRSTAGVFIPKLLTLHQSENLYITHSEYSIDGWTLNSGKVFSLSNMSFTCCTTFQNFLFTFDAHNQIQALKVPPPSESAKYRERPLAALEPVTGISLCPIDLPAGQMNQDPIQEAKVQWPYLLGFKKSGVSIWNINERPAKPITFSITKLDFIGLWKKQVVYLKNKCIVSLNMETFEEIRLFNLENFNFKTIHMDGPRIICALTKEEKKEEHTMLLIDLFRSDSIKLLPIDFSFLSRTFIYDAQFYWCDKALKVLGAISLEDLSFLSVLPMKEKNWPSQEMKDQKNAKGLKMKLINGLIHTRTKLVNLATSVLPQLNAPDQSRNTFQSHMGNTLCAHNYYALDYSKTVYLNGHLIRGYPCSPEDSNIQILDFNPPPPSAEAPPVDAMDIT